MKRNILFSVMLIILCTTINGCEFLEGKISGFITDKTTGNPIEGAVVVRVQADADTDTINSILNAIKNLGGIENNQERIDFVRSVVGTVADGIDAMDADSNGFYSSYTGFDRYACIVAAIAFPDHLNPAYLVIDSEPGIFAKLFTRSLEDNNLELE